MRLTSTQLPPAQTAEQQTWFWYRVGVNPEQAFNACILNLRLIDAAKQQWALERGKPKGSLVGPADLTPYLKSNAMPACPAGGVYTINPVGIDPLCNTPGHALPR